MNRLVSSFVVCLAAFSATGCGSTTSGGGGVTLTDTGVGSDTGLTGDTATGTDATTGGDVAKADTSPADTSAMDTSPADTGAMDTGPADTGAMDTGPMDTGPADTGAMDTGPADTGASGDVASGACTDPADEAIVNSKDVQSIAGTCAQTNLLDATKTTACIKTQTGLSDPCIVCFSGIVTCSITNCIGQCMSDSTSPACTSCVQTSCATAFDSCSGLTM